MHSPVPTDHRLFHSLVTAALALVPACAGPSHPSTTQRATQPDVGPDAASADTATTPETETGPAEVAQTGEGDACACVPGDFATCQANGVTCCWAHHECCEPCCPSV